MDGGPITISRRFDMADGRFAGVAVAVIDCDLFTQFYASFDVGVQGSIALLNKEGRIISRFPVPTEADYHTRKVTQTWLYKGRSGRGRLVSGLDGVARIYSFQTAGTLPLIVVVARSEDEVLARWRRDAWVDLLACSMVSAMLCLVGWAIAHQIRQREQRERDLRASEAQYRLLADNASDAITCLGMDLKRIYILARVQTDLRL